MTGEGDPLANPIAGKIYLKYRMPYHPPLNKGMVAHER